MAEVSVLIPTYNRLTALAVTLTSLSLQTFKDFSVIISDQSENNEINTNPSLQTIYRILESYGCDLHVIRHLPKKGIAEQRQFLLAQSKSIYSLFLDDDLFLEPFVVSNLFQAIKEEKCGYVGQAVIGLSYKDDYRPYQEQIEFWQSKVKPEKIDYNSVEWQRYKLHNAANIYHIQKKLNITPKNQKKYKISWVGGCTMYDTKKLISTGGFSFWKKLPENHCGEDVLAQMRVMRKYGGCGLIPSGVYHQELPTTIFNREINAPEVLK